ncbi:MAG: hypothetical protein AAF443_01250 [Chlamydiota bacterium]
MENGNSLYPWIIFVLFLASYFLRVIRWKKKQQQQREERKQQQPLPQKQRQVPPAPPVKKPKTVVVPAKKSAEQHQLPIRSSGRTAKKTSMKHLIQSLPSKKSMILLAEILNRRDDH